MGTSVPSDIDIARAARLRPLAEIAERTGPREDELLPFGHTKAKIHLDALKRIGSNPRGKYVVVTAITPTPLGEGKTTTTVGLTQGLGHTGQEAIACTPIISVDYKAGKFNFSARYEFNTKVRLENDTKDNSTGISQFDDDKPIAADIPANLNIGAQYSIKPNFRISLGANYYFDKQSKQYNNETGKNDKQNYLKHNSFEILGGLEYDVCKWATLSIGANSSTFGFGNDAKYISDMGYSSSSVSGGLGAQFHVTGKINIDLGVYRTFFMHFTKEQADYGGNGALIYNKLAPVLSKLPIDPSIAQKLTPENLAITGKDEFFRTSIVAGVGVSFAF